MEPKHKAKALAAKFVALRLAGLHQRPQGGQQCAQPDPDGPNSTVISPAIIATSMPLRTSASALPSPKLLASPLPDKMALKSTLPLTQNLNHISIRVRIPLMGRP